MLRPQQAVLYTESRVSRPFLFPLVTDKGGLAFIPAQTLGTASAHSRLQIDAYFVSVVWTYRSTAIATAFPPPRQSAAIPR